MNRRLAALLALAFLVGCGGTPKPNNAGFVRDVQRHHAAEVTVVGNVASVLPDGNGPDGPHERFDLRVGSVLVEIDHNLTLAPRAPVHVGETVEVHGQFEPDPGHPVIHYTHHATGSHEGGWIKAGGKTYS